MLTKRILIENENTTLQRQYITKKGNRVYRKYKQIPTQIFFSKFTTQSIILPQNTRFHKSYDSNTHLFVTEYKPQMRTINLSMQYARKWDVFLNWCERKNIKKKEAIKFLESFGNRTGHEWKFQLLFPYIIMITVINQKEKYNNAFMFLNQKPITNLKTILYKIPMYNIAKDQHVCMRSSLLSSVSEVLLSNVVDMSFKAYFESSFNSDFSYNLTSYRYRQMFNNYFIWAYVSKNDPFAIFKQKLVTYKSIGQIINDIEEVFRISQPKDVSDLSKIC